MKYKKGENIILTQGAYSDYSILDAYVVLKDFDTADIMLLYLDQHKEQAKEHEFEADDFKTWLEANAFVKLLKIREWLIEEYGSAIVKYEYQDQLHGEAEDENQNQGH